MNSQHRTVQTFVDIQISKPHHGHITQLSSHPPSQPHYSLLTTHPYLTTHHPLLNNKFPHHSHRSVVPHRAVVLKCSRFIRYKLHLFFLTFPNLVCPHIKLVDHKIVRARNIFKCHPHRIPLLHIYHIRHKLKRTPLHRKLFHCPTLLHRCARRNHTGFSHNFFNNLSFCTLSF